MIPKDKAAELIEKYKDYVHGYVGSSMLTNYEYPDQIISQAKKASLIVVEEILSFVERNKRNADFNLSDIESYYRNVKNEIETTN